VSEEAPLQPVSKIDVYSSVPGKLRSISVDVGDHVTPGQVLAEIEAPELLVELEEAEAVVEKEQARVNWVAARRSSIELTASEGGDQATLRRKLQLTRSSRERLLG
jgi:multidrug efflux pump subunit AcrA (membrane-fusion protein)